MFRFKSIALILVLALICLAAPAQAQVSKAFQDADQALRAKTFSVIARQSYYVLNTASAACAILVDSTATNAASIAYAPATISPPFLVSIQNLGANPIYYAPKTGNFVSSTEYLTVPTATCPYLVANDEQATSTIALAYGETKEIIFFDTPDWVFGGGGSPATFVIEIRIREVDPYLP